MLHTLKPSEGSRKKKKRVGRGSGSGHGGTSCRGHKGQNARAGGGKGPGFEGGQMPLQRRLPKRGFNNKFKTNYAIVNLKDLNQFTKDTEITIEVLKFHGIISPKEKLIKVLADGIIEKALIIKAHKFSQQAIEKIEESGGKAEVIGN